ncbi:MAG: PPOX class F420-dependent oxidoreductase [Polyangia bacterium]
MANVLSEQQINLIRGKNFAYIGALSEDGSPQVTPVWIDWDGENIVFNTEKKRAKTKNLQSDPRVAVCISNSENPYQYVEVRGQVVGMTEEGADEHIDKMAKKYMGKDKYPFHKPGDVRVIVKIEPQKVFAMG